MILTYFDVFERILFIFLTFLGPGPKPRPQSGGGPGPGRAPCRRFGVWAWVPGPRMQGKWQVYVKIR